MSTDKMWKYCEKYCDGENACFDDRSPVKGKYRQTVKRTNCGLSIFNENPITVSIHFNL